VQFSLIHDLIVLTSVQRGHTVTLLQEMDKDVSVANLILTVAVKMMRSFSIQTLTKDITAVLSLSQEILVVERKFLKSVIHATLSLLSVICETLAITCSRQEFVLPFQVMYSAPVMMIAKNPQICVMSLSAVANQN